MSATGEFGMSIALRFDFLAFAASFGLMAAIVLGLF
jgi:hypothetical protein